MKQIKTGILVLVLTIIIISAVINMARQFSALLEAKNKIQQMQTAVAELKETNQKLKNQIALATSSAYIEQQVRDKFGMGSENDAWLILPEEKKTNNFLDNHGKDLKPKFLQWFDLFTN